MNLRHSPEQVEHWLTRVYGDAAGLLNVVHQDAAGRFNGTGGTVPGVTEALQRVAALDSAGAQGIYLRTTTLARQLQAHERGGASDSLALPGLWADVDFGATGHKPAPAGLPLPPNETEARRIVDESGLPTPTLWVHSGGGLYPWWLLDSPLPVDGDVQAMAAQLSAGWQQALKRSAEALGYDYGAGVGDLSRVLRLPGTINRKAGLERPCQLLEDTGQAYTLTELMQALTAQPQTTPVPLRADPPPPKTRAPGGTGASLSAFDALDQHVTFDELLTGAGWAHHNARHPVAVEQCWSRPGGPDNPCSAHTLKANPHVLVVHSELAGLPTGGGQKLTRGRLFAHLHHHGDERAASLDLYAAMAGRPATTAAASLPLPRETRPMTTSTVGLHDLVALEHQAARLHADTPPVATTAGDDAWERERLHLLRVEEEADKIRVREAARELIAREKRGDRADAIILDGATFLLAETTRVPAIWGSDTDVLWAEGEPTMICGLPGVGKTTIAGQVLRARLGIGDGRVLGYPVTPTGSRVLYLAMDRPRQIQRALARLFTTDDHRELADRLVVRMGPPPEDLAGNTDLLAELAHKAGADTVFVDSLKDAVLGLSEDGPAAGYNRARQTAIAAGVEVFELHHMRKQGAAGGKPNSLGDVYGSTWLTSGAGSVIVLNGDPGDALVELRHLKQPAAEVGPFKVLHDSTTGHSSVFHATDLLAMARAKGQISARDAAKAIAETEKPTANDVEKARRRLEALVKKDQLWVWQQGNKALNLPTLWAPVDDPSTTITTPFTAPPSRETSTTPSQASRQNTKPQVRDHHGTLHGHHAQGPSRTPLSLEERGGESATAQTDLDAVLGPACPHCNYRTGHAQTCTRQEAS